MADETTRYRVYKTYTVAGNPPDEPTLDFEGTLREFRRKYQRGRGWDDLGPSGTDDFSQSFRIQQWTGTDWEDCGDPR